MFLTITVLYWLVIKLVDVQLIPPKPIIEPFISEIQDEIDAFNEMINDPRWIEAGCFREQCRI